MFSLGALTLALVLDASWFADRGNSPEVGGWLCLFAHYPDTYHFDIAWKTVPGEYMIHRNHQTPASTTALTTTVVKRPALVGAAFSVAGWLSKART